RDDARRRSLLRRRPLAAADTQRGGLDASRCRAGRWPRASLDRDGVAGFQDRARPPESLAPRLSHLADADARAVRLSLRVDFRADARDARAQVERSSAAVALVAGAAGRRALPRRWCVRSLG